MVSFFCSLALLSGADSAHFYLNKAEENLNVNSLISEVVSGKCPKENLQFKKIGCRLVIPRDEFTRVCYAETNIGYFFVMRDMLDGVNIIYNRWD